LASGGSVFQFKGDRQAGGGTGKKIEGNCQIPQRQAEKLEKYDYTGKRAQQQWGWGFNGGNAWAKNVGLKGPNQETTGLAPATSRKNVAEVVRKGAKGKNPTWTKRGGVLDSGKGTDIAQKKTGRDQISMSDKKRGGPANRGKETRRGSRGEKGKRAGSPGE